MKLRSTELTRPVWLLRSRVAPPRHNRQLVRRERVLAILAQVRLGQVVLASAPPGFGKSVALTQWLDEGRTAGHRTAWLTIDDRDDPRTLVQYLAFACQLGGLNVAGTGLLVDTVVSAERQPGASLELQSLLAAIENSGSSWLLVLDEVERATAQAIREVIEPLCRFLPENLILAIGTRDSNALDLSRLADRGLLVTVGAESLRLNRMEIQQLWGSQATRAQARVIEQRSGGWPALLQIILQQGPSTISGASTPSMPGAAEELLESRLFARVDPRVRRLMRDLSVFESFTSVIASELTGFDDIEPLLGQIASLGVLARVESARSVEFSIYPMLRRHLLLRFESEDPTAVRDLNRRAARAFLAVGDFVAAARHASMVGDHEFLADVVEAVEPLQLGIREGFPRLRQIVRFVPDELACRRPRIGLACAASYLKAGRLRHATQLFASLELNRCSDPGEPPESSKVAFERALVGSLLSVYNGAPILEAQIGELDRLVTDASLTAPLVRSLAETLRCYVFQQDSRFIEAKVAALRAIAYAEEAESPYAAYFMYCDLGMIAGIEGNAAAALEQFAAGDRACLSTVQRDERLTSIRDAFRGEVEHEVACTDSSRIARMKNVCLRLPTLEGWPDVYEAAYRTYSEQLFLGGELPGALAILSAGINHLSEQEVGGAPVVLKAQQAMLLALAGRSSEARERLTRAIESCCPTGDRVAGRPWREVEALIEAEAALAAVGGEAAPESLIDAIDRASAAGNVRSEARFRRWVHVLEAAQPTGRVGVVDLRRLTDLEAHSGFRRTAALLAAAPAIRHRQVANPLAASLADGQALSAVTVYLTAREIAVITCLNRGLSDKAIAKDLGISAHGVRYHLKRIYAKLHARDRQEARVKASALGLM